MLCLKVITLIIFVAEVKPKKTPKLHPDAGLNIIELTKKYGYPLESHEVQTEDGYILTLHRLPPKLNSTQNDKKPILLMHGLWSSSVDWVNLGPGAALALLLADEGYDVWLGNQRGNTWSKKHISLDPDQAASKFFDFSYHEIGVYDLPAKINYILDKTNHDKMFYIGHSQGTTVFFVMCSERPEYNEKIELMTALAPVAYMGNMPHPLVQPAASNYLDLIETLIDIIQIHEFVPHYKFLTDLGNHLCNQDSEYQQYCVWALNFIAGFDSEIDPNFISVITSNVPAGGSVKQVVHYFQGVQTGTFAQYDYGTENIGRYGQQAPPIYNISKISASVCLFYANNDWLNSVEDVLQLEKELPNVVKSKKVPSNDFNHLEFLWARNVVDLLYTDVISGIKAMGQK